MTPEPEQIRFNEPQVVREVFDGRAAQPVAAFGNLTAFEFAQRISACRSNADRDRPPAGLYGEQETR